MLILGGDDDEMYKLQLRWSDKTIEPSTFQFHRERRKRIGFADNKLFMLERNVSFDFILAHNNPMNPYIYIAVEARSLSWAKLLI